MKKLAEKYLELGLNKPGASFRDGQWEAISAALDFKRLLIVQRTGWGKSMVYFIATKILRSLGRGPTILVSPLLSLMRNQIDAASRLNLEARTINSANTEDWNKIYEELSANKVDILLLSPERLANADFMQGIFSEIANKVGLLVVDEAHCISDWGHDFRPEYRLIVRILRLLPENMPVLATTATANDRVVNDIRAQLGENLLVQRGPLTRQSLMLQNIFMPGRVERMAWLAQKIPTLPGCGIVYTLTRRDAEIVAEWLMSCGIKAKAYHSDTPDREELEKQLLNHEIKVLAATVALGMGFDMPDLGFVIHFQRPASVVHYYQQVGRAGRAVDGAYGILLCGEEDDAIADYFRKSSFPPQRHISKILEVLGNAAEGLSIFGLQKVLNIGKGEINKAIKFLEMESPSPIVKIDKTWRATPYASSYEIDQKRINDVIGTKIAEQLQMREYMEHKECLMAFLQTALDDPFPAACGKCANCNPALLPDHDYDPGCAARALEFLRGTYETLTPKKLWPTKDIFEKYPIGGFRITRDLSAREGMALCIWRNAGWGEIVANDKYIHKKFSDDLVAACVKMLAEWRPEPAPQWLACVPSLTHKDLVPDFAKKLAAALGLPFVPCVEKIEQNREQKHMDNSFQQVKNLDGVFRIRKDLVPEQPCLLIDDIVGSGWTMTVVSALLRMAGCPAVFPLALALNSTRMD